MRLIFLFIIKLIFIKTEDCQSSLSPLCVDEDGDGICERCQENGNFPTSDDLACCPKNSNIEGYYWDNSEEKFKKCDQSCKNCKGGPLNCVSCNNLNGYFEIGGLSIILCKTINEIGYYLDDKVLKPCYMTCETCSKGEDDTHHNCDSCKDNYFLDGTNCFSECSKDLFIFGNFKCVPNCREENKEFFSELLTKTCVEECPDGMKKNEKDGLCIIERTSVYEDYDCKDIIEKFIEPNIEYYISENSYITGKNCYIQVYNSSDQNKIHKIANIYKLSKLFLNSEYINTNTAVIKIDYNQTFSLQPEVNDIEFILFKMIDNKYNRINDIDLITPINSDDLIYIEKPFIYTENIRLYKDKYELFDIFNAKDEVYNNVCITFKSEFNTDVTCDYRRDIYFYNLTQYCLNDSTKYYSSFNADSLSIQCKSNYVENNFIEKKVGNSKYKIFKCKKYLTKQFAKTWGFWVILFYLIFNVVLFVPFIMTRFKNIVNFMRIFERAYNKPTGLKLKWTVLNPPKKNIKVIYKPKEFILSDEFLEEENELKLKYNLLKNIEKRKKNKNKKNNENEKNTNIGKNKNKTVYENKSKNSQNEFSEGSKSINTQKNDNEDKDKGSENNNNNDIFHMYSSVNSNSSFTKNEKQKKEEEEKEKERRRIENEKFKEDLSMKERKQNDIINHI